MTSPECKNGTERIAEYVRGLRVKPAIVINLQGDSPIIPPAVISALITAMQSDSTIEFGTVATPIGWDEVAKLQREKESEGSRGTMVVVDSRGDALYFSKQIIPYVRTRPASGESPYRRHLGLYGYRPALLQRMCTLPESPLEQCEGLEQLRALENGIKIRVVAAPLGSRTIWSVDSPADVAIVEGIIRAEGEL